MLKMAKTIYNSYIFSDYYNESTSLTDLNTTNGDLVASRFTENSSWYRAKVIEVDREFNKVKV